MKPYNGNLVTEKFGVGAKELPLDKTEDCCNHRLCLNMLSLTAGRLFSRLVHNHSEVRLPNELEITVLSVETEVLAR